MKHYDVRYDAMIFQFIIQLSFLCSTKVSYTYLMIVIPVVNAKTFGELRAGLERAKKFSKWAHVDVADQTFTDYETWKNPAELDLLLEDSLKIELHLMIKVDRSSIRKWIKERVARIIVHVEASDDIESVIKVIKKEKRECGVALKRETSVSTIQKLIPFI